MYALNTFLRFARFLANSIIGIGVGFVVGYLVGASGTAIPLIEKFL